MHSTLLTWEVLRCRKPCGCEKVGIDRLGVAGPQMLGRRILFLSVVVLEGGRSLREWAHGTSLRDLPLEEIKVPLIGSLVNPPERIIRRPSHSLSSDFLSAHCSPHFLSGFFPPSDFLSTHSLPFYFLSGNKIPVFQCHSPRRGVPKRDRTRIGTMPFGFSTSKTASYINLSSL